MVGTQPHVLGHHVQIPSYNPFCNLLPIIPCLQLPWSNQASQCTYKLPGPLVCIAHAMHTARHPRRLTTRAMPRVPPVTRGAPGPPACEVRGERPLSCMEVECARCWPSGRSGSRDSGAWPRSSPSCGMDSDQGMARLQDDQEIRWQQQQRPYCTQAQHINPMQSPQHVLCTACNSVCPCQAAATHKPLHGSLLHEMRSLNLGPGYWHAPSRTRPAQRSGRMLPQSVAPRCP